jgi:hypothetical protein
MSYAIMANHQLIAILVVDIYLESPATVTAANNLVRYTFSAAAAAVVIPTLKDVGRG